jgi:ABC-type phosphate transport system substrate-binding protein
MKRGARFKLLVLLSGEGQGIVVKGHLRRGSVAYETRVRGPRAMNIGFGAVLLLLIGIQAGITFRQTDRPSLPSFCGTGQLAMEGSTAFAPAARSIGNAYTAVCPGASVSVSAIATFNGLDEVAASGSDVSKAAAIKANPPPPTQIAMSDGLAPAGYSKLVGHAVAVIVFAVVVNREETIFNLSTEQLRGIFLGQITNWKQINGVDLPITIVARTTASGTRRAFDENVLGGLAEPPFSSYNCFTRNVVTTAKYTRCEVTDTSTLLQKVNTIPGAIGYAQISDAATYPNISKISINGRESSIGDVELHTYQFWTVEYLYTAGPLASGSLGTDFLDYMDSPTSSDILRSEGYIPCVDRGQVNALCRSPALAKLTSRELGRHPADAAPQGGRFRHVR